MLKNIFKYIRLDIDEQIKIIFNHTFVIILQTTKITCKKGREYLLYAATDPLTLGVDNDCLYKDYSRVISSSAITTMFILPDVIIIIVILYSHKTWKYKVSSLRDKVLQFDHNSPWIYFRRRITANFYQHTQSAQSKYKLDLIRKSVMVKMLNSLTPMYW